MLRLLEKGAIMATSPASYPKTLPDADPRQAARQACTQAPKREPGWAGGAPAAPTTPAMRPPRLYPAAPPEFNDTSWVGQAVARLLAGSKARSSPEGVRREPAPVSASSRAGSAADARGEAKRGPTFPSSWISEHRT